MNGWLTKTISFQIIWAYLEELFMLLFYHLPQPRWDPLGHVQCFGVVLVCVLFGKPFLLSD